MMHLRLLGSLAKRGLVNTQKQLRQLSLAIAQCAALLVLSSILFAADSTKTPQPGQLAKSDIAVWPSSASDSTPSPAPTVSVASVEDQHDRTMNRLWIASMAALVAGTSFDAASSWGKLESNSLLAGSNGTFGAKGLAIKGGLAAAIIIPQICLRKHKELRSAFSFANFGQASLFTAGGIHNLRIRSANAQ